MKKPSVGLAREGLPIICLCAFSSLILSLIGCWPVAIIFLCITWFACFFFRDPERAVPAEKGLVVSPADGKVVRIQELPEPFEGEKRLCVSVFMSLFSVHVNRMPVDGKITSILYSPGKFFNAAWDKASEFNERCAYKLTSKDDTFAMVQIAGLVAQRIVCRVENGEELERGERFGMIKFGSRVDVYLPASYAPSVAVGQQVFAGQTVLAKKS
ncbi:phosphatidylserine decarboxylase family protein [Desulfovibrio intestinalis]|uniref:Phosphatidylserine decarboxylase proenzyme n=1 Tax=Desulfovibrio intestinalis TaxID=58621 RepID=A0A7W8FDW1_9BACT|nr:phosphatidylserine decarboxylase family protein [Desulfovibrio intestinalis]MBB5142143.1 phosphatidylserine decarboxylase [Desulfovibrio intestinalis]